MAELCPFCGLEFIPNHRNQKFCSRPHMRAAARARDAESRAAWMKANRDKYRNYRPCESCGARVVRGDSVGGKCSACKRLDWISRRSVEVWRGVPEPPVTVVPGAWWCAGKCAVCESDFVSPHTDRCCSDACKRLRARNKFGDKKWISQNERLAIYRRDAFTCQICSEPVDLTAEPHTDWYPSLDHIIPRSKGGAHDRSNLRTAHRWCNAVRGDLTYYTDADLQSA